MEIGNIIRSLSPFLKAAGVKISPETVRVVNLEKAEQRIDAIARQISPEALREGSTCGLLTAEVNGRTVNVFIVQCAPVGAPALGELFTASA